MRPLKIRLQECLTTNQMNQPFSINNHLANTNSGIEITRLCAVILITFTHTTHSVESGLLFVILEQLPTFGTAILSVISGYLYIVVSSKKPDLFQKKVKSLLVPYLIANAVVLALVLIANYGFGHNMLNRLAFDENLILDGLLALNRAPINPPTYFIRDVFVIFAILSLVFQREVKALFVLVPVLAFGSLFLNPGIVFLFAAGCFYAQFGGRFEKQSVIILFFILSVATAVFAIEYLKFPVAILLFIAIVDLKFPTYKTGRFSYLLHLYHSPVMIVAYAASVRFVDDVLSLVLIQILVAIVAAYVIFLASCVYKPLLILSGGR